MAENLFQEGDVGTNTGDENQGNREENAVPQFRNLQAVGKGA